MWTRLGKIMLVALAALYATLVAINNITDYGSNFQFVQHVLSMDTTFPENRLMWRAIESRVLLHACYIVIILVEAMVAVLGWMGVIVLWSVRHDSDGFNTNKSLAMLALMLGIGLWFGGFIVVGGEWFLMWQSKIWNGIDASFRVSALFAMILIILTMNDPAPARDRDE